VGAVGPVRKGMAEIEQVARDVLREFSTRRRQIEEHERELVASGVEVRRAGREAIAHATRERKRYGIDTAPSQELVRARAAEHGLGARELKALARGPARAPQRPDAQSVSGELTGAAGLTERQNTFARREAVMAWAAARGQGATADAVEHAAAQFITRPDVHRASDPSEPRFTTSDLIAYEEVIVRGAQARRGEGSGRLGGALVDAVLENAPFAPTAEQVAVILGLTSSGHGVDSVEALAGTGKTFTAGLLGRAYAQGGFRVLGTAPTARAVRELKEEAGITQAWTLTRLSLDLDADPSGFGTGAAVLILDEAGMASTRETARVLEHAGAKGVKVIAIGDSGQLSSVQAGGWLGSLTRRLGSYELREVMRQRDPRERALLAHVRRGDPGDYLTEKTARGQLQIFSGDHESALAAEQTAIAVWRDRQAASPTPRRSSSRATTPAAHASTRSRAPSSNAKVGWATASTSPAGTSPSATASSPAATTGCARSTTACAARSSPLTRPRRNCSSAPTPAPNGHSTLRTPPSTSSTPTPSPRTRSRAGPSIGPAWSGTPTTSPATGPTPPCPAHATPPRSSSSTPQPSTNSTATRSHPATPRSSATSERRSSA
jgi:hypothetical protein